MAGVDGGLSRRALRFDAALAVALFALDLLLWVLEPREYWPKSWPIAIAWHTVAYVGLALRRRALPAAVGLVAVQVTLAQVVPGLATAAPALLVMTYTAAAHRSWRYAGVATLTMWMLPVAAALSPLGQEAAAAVPVEVPTAFLLVWNTMVMLVCFFLGRAVFNRRAYVSALEDRAAYAELDRQTIVERAVADERRRIARELHDVVAHHVSVMGVLATGTRRALPRDPRAADEALATIEETGRVALREMRRLLFVLRSDAEPAGELEPQPGLPGIEGLLEQVREAGLPVELIVTGDPGRLVPGSALAVYRITQEALTNALKHAGPASAEVRLTFTTKELAIEISDTGRGPRPGLAAGEATPGPLPVSLGHGLLGMRERINLYGGTLRAGARSGGGFRVAARIPLEPEFTAYSIEKDLLA
jgi:signal transduction histidine kinase